MNKILIAPSILSADFANLSSEISKIDLAGADLVHVDVMDGHFVPNITIGAPVVESLRKTTKMPLDVHLMIENPEKYIEDFAKAGSDIITIHYEAVKDLPAIINQIKGFGIKAGVSIKPKTPPEVLFDVLELLDMVLVMSVEPGFGGQSFMHCSLPKIKAIREKAPNLDIEVDGGINPQTAVLVKEAGANILVAGSSVYHADDIKNAIKTLKNV